jgi:pimeloyl-ACP methyl ester carboxylesterase
LVSFESGLAKTRGTDLYFERRGSGPPLLMIAGGGGDCGVYGPAAELLAETYTVLTYDRRGNSRSLLHGRPVKTNPSEQSEDAVAVIKANGFDSALVFGSSGGAIVALEMVAHQGDAVDGAVAHEPAIPNVLPDGKEILASYDEVYRSMETEGWAAAFRRFLALNYLVRPGDAGAIAALLEPEKVLPPGPLLDLLRRESGNWAYMMEYEVRPFVEYVPDFSAMKRNGVRIATAGGKETRGVYYHRASEAIAERLGVEFVEFRGGHSPAIESPSTFVSELRPLLGRLTTRRGQGDRVR